MKLDKCIVSGANSQTSYLRNICRIIKTRSWHHFNKEIYIWWRYIVFNCYWRNIVCLLRSGVDEEEMESLDLVSEKEESVFSKPNKTGYKLVLSGSSTCHYVCV